jgi:hypothetical protein
MERKIRKQGLLIGLMSLIFFMNVSAQSFRDLKNIFKPDYGQWKLSDSIRIYNPDNLYDYIDGAADNYLTNNFQNLMVVTYIGSGDKYITIEIYQHQTDLHTFAIYAQERPAKGQFSKIGAQGYQEKGMINFLCDKYYVKLSTHDESPETGIILNSIAADVAVKLAPDSRMPKLLNYFPEVDKIRNSENLINTNFLGYECLKMALTATYGKDDKTYKVFIMALPSVDEAKLTMNRYMEVIKKSFTGKEGQYTVKDPHNGKIILEWKGRYIWGILNEKNIKLTNDYLKLVSDQLTGAKEL